MSSGAKRLARMKRNPKDDWQISDVVAVCHSHGVACEPPSKGSHYTVSHPKVREILTIPAHKPIKPVYIVRLVLFIETVIGSTT